MPGATRISTVLSSLALAACKPRARMVMSLLGGAIGIMVGVAASIAIGRALKWPVLVSTPSILIAVVFSVAVGIFFGYYPAKKASQLDPIEALRYE